jgi:CRISPR/Cas system CSM-associated protein Csm3 (group 7 of RAMP superfamily)
MPDDVRYFITATLRSESPLHIGSGEGDATDSDVLCDADKKPFIPATTIAGVARHYLATLEETPDEIFGFTTDGADTAAQSKIIFYDAELTNESAVSVSIRDNVKISDDGAAADKGKFDYEILEPGAEFKFRAELASDNKERAREIFDKILSGINNGDIAFGAKTSRGLGSFTVLAPKHSAIDLTKDFHKYIDFKWDSVAEDFVLDDTDSKLYETLSLKFTIDAFLLVRNYATLFRDAGNNGKVVDFEQLLYANENAVIPGTSWAGVFRHHFRMILDKTVYPDAEAFENCLFGYVIEKTQEKAAAKILFSESEIKTPTLRNRTRNAVDRFTGGAGDKKLFTSRPNYKGNGKLKIKLAKTCKDAELVKSLIDVCIADFNDGFLNIGGEGSTGGGLVKFEKDGDWH